MRDLLLPARATQAIVALRPTTPAQAPVRRGAAVLRAVEERPGITVTELLARCGVSSGTLSYHLGRLERAGLVRTVVSGRRRLVFPRGSEEREHARALSILRGRTARAVAEAVAWTPHLALEELVERLGESPRAVYYHLKALRDAGLVVTSSARWYRDIAPGPRLAELLALTRDDPAAPPQ